MHHRPIRRENAGHKFDLGDAMEPLMIALAFASGPKRRVENWSFRRQSGRWQSLLNSARDPLVDELRGKYPVRFMG